MIDEITNAANEIATFTTNTGLNTVIDEYLRFKYIEHKKSHNKCGCKLCYEIKQVTFWHRQLELLQYANGGGWRGGWKSASPAYINASNCLREHRQKRDELKNKVSTYLWEENLLD